MVDDHYKIKELSVEEFSPLYKKYKDSVFEDDHSYVLWDLLSKEELDNIEELGKSFKNPYKINLAAFDKYDNFVGWSWGFQENSTTFYMCNSGVLKEHRRKGIYRALVGKCLEIATKKGFQLIYSRHCATNNSVIIPKLKAGFIISKMEIEDKFGVVIHLHYYTNKTRKKIMDYRAGQIKPGDEIKRIFKL